MSIARWTQHRTHAVPASDSWTERVAALKREVTEKNDRAKDRAHRRAEFYDRQMRAHAANRQPSTLMDTLV